MKGASMRSHRPRPFIAKARAAEARLSLSGLSVLFWQSFCNAASRVADGRSQLALS
jgi:hypothetical protein